MLSDISICCNPLTTALSLATPTGSTDNFRNGKYSGSSAKISIKVFAPSLFFTSLVPDFPFTSHCCAMAICNSLDFAFDVLNSSITFEISA